MSDPIDITDDELALVEALGKRCLMEGATLGAVRGYTGDELEAVYNLAHNAYRQRKYRQAVELFQFLVENDHAEHRFWMGLAAAHQMADEPNKALIALGMTTLLDATNPWPSIHACECYITLGNSDQARLALNSAEGVCEATEHKQDNQSAMERIKKLEQKLSQPITPRQTPEETPKPQQTPSNFGSHSGTRIRTRI